MPKKSRKSKDPNKRAFQVVQEATEELAPTGKNPAAVALGRLGGMKGGKARAEALSAKRRKEIAQKAARARWKNKPDK